MMELAVGETQSWGIIIINTAMGIHNDGNSVSTKLGSECSFSLMDSNCPAIAFVEFFPAVTLAAIVAFSAASSRRSMKGALASLSIAFHATLAAFDMSLILASGISVMYCLRKSSRKK